MSGYDTEAAAIRTRLKTQWGTRTPIAWENVAFTPPDGPWIRPTILPVDADQADCAPVGSRRYRHQGLLVIQVFVPAGQGDGEARELVEAACAAFRGLTASGVVYETPYAETVGSDGTWYQVNAVCPFYRDTLY